MIVRIFWGFGLCVSLATASASSKRPHDTIELQGGAPKHRPFKSPPPQLQAQPQEIITDFILPYLTLSDKARVVRVNRYFASLCQHDLVYQDLIKNLAIKDKRPSALETFVAFNSKTESPDVVWGLIERMLNHSRQEIYHMAFTDLIYPLMCQKIKRPSIDFFFKIYEELMVIQIRQGKSLPPSIKNQLSRLRECEAQIKRFWTIPQNHHLLFIERNLGLLKQTDSTNLNFYEAFLKEYSIQPKLYDPKTISLVQYYWTQEILKQNSPALSEKKAQIFSFLTEVAKQSQIHSIYVLTSKIQLAKLRLRGQFYGPTILREEQLSEKQAVENWRLGLSDSLTTHYIQKQTLSEFLCAFFNGDIKHSYCAPDQAFDLIEWGFSKKLIDDTLSPWYRYRQALMKIDGWLVKNTLSWETILKFLLPQAQGLSYRQERAHFEIGMLRMNNHLPENIVSWAMALEHFRMINLHPQYAGQADLYATLIEMDHFSQKLSQDKIQRAYVTLKTASTSHADSSRKEKIQKHMETLFLRLDPNLYPYEGPCVLIPPPQK